MTGALHDILQALPDAVVRARFTHGLIDPVLIGATACPLAERYVLRKSLEGCVYVHHWLRSDPDDLHDHPWPFTSVILIGGYWEVTPAGRKWRDVGSTSFVSEHDLHRVEVDPAVPDVWSMVIAGPKVKNWGFKVGDTMVPWRDYRGDDAAAIEAARGHHA